MKLKAEQFMPRHGAKMVGTYERYFPKYLLITPAINAFVADLDLLASLALPCFFPAKDL